MLDARARWARPKCWLEMSASVQWVAMRTTARRWSTSLCRSETVPTPGTSRTAIVARSAPRRRRRSAPARGHGGEAVVEGGAAKPVAVADLDRRHAGAGQGGTPCRDLVLAELVGDGVAPSRRVVSDDQEFLAHAGIGPLYRHWIRWETLAGALRRRGHDVEVARVPGAGSRRRRGHLEQHGDPAGDRPHGGPGGSSRTAGPR